MTAIAESDVARRVVVTTGQRFYVRIAAACVAVAFIGFAPTYWVPLFRGTLRVGPLAHVHGALFYGWTLLFLAQTWLAASRQFTRHRAFGVFGVSVATAMCFVGTATAINSLKQAEAAGFADAGRAFVIVPMSGVAFFATLFTIALLKIKRLETHKRLMIVATVSLLQAAVARWFVFFLAPVAAAGVAVSPPPVTVSVLPGLVTDLLLVWAMLHDRKTRGSVHPVYWIAGGAMVALQVLRVPLSTTTAWTNFATWLGTLAL